MVTIAAALAVAGVAQAQTAVPQPNAQQVLDSGEAAIAAGRYAQAISTLTALEGRLAAKGNPNLRSLAAVRAWLGLAALTPERHDEHDRSGSRKQAAILALAQAEPVTSAPRARAGVELVAAEHAAEYRDFRQARTILEQIVALSIDALAADDPIRRAAAIRLASLQAASGAREAAAATFASSGIAPSQCALLDQTPLVKRRTFSSSDYPDALLRLNGGFDGWAVTEFDVTHDGRTENARVLIAYPPFLFGDSAAHISKRTIYQPSFRPDGALSCGGYRDRVNFRAASLPQ